MDIFFLPSFHIVSNERLIGHNKRGKRILHMGFLKKENPRERMIMSLPLSEQSLLINKLVLED